MLGVTQRQRVRVPGVGADRGTCTLGCPPADAFTAPRLPSVS